MPIIQVSAALLSDYNVELVKENELLKLEINLQHTKITVSAILGIVSLFSRQDVI